MEVVTKQNEGLAAINRKHEVMISRKRTRPTVLIIYAECHTPPCQICSKKKVLLIFNQFLPFGHYINEFCHSKLLSLYPLNLLFPSNTQAT